MNQVRQISVFLCYSLSDFKLVLLSPLFMAHSNTHTSIYYMPIANVFVFISTLNFLLQALLFLFTISNVSLLYIPDTSNTYF
ncbi:hypothetical protein BX070DRAFT_222156 [Coemansia spiralis]|nr:hypothetical protein BX070DRAFT_222156 [Coemansia spiralis]